MKEQGIYTSIGQCMSQPGGVPLHMNVSWMTENLFQVDKQQRLWGFSLGEDLPGYTAASGFVRIDLYGRNGEADK